ncbi:hypothetical protein NHQ30_006224 [Ciborinia camelliae]|nr:hypothetical protein NHQ30_006224 [Ciborinia camelliae]
MHQPIITKTITGEISKKRKPVLSPKSPSAISPDRLLRRPKNKQLAAAVVRGLQADAARAVDMQDVVMQDVSEYYGLAEPEPMDTREDYEWDYPGFDGYLLQEFENKRGMFPEMELSKENQVLYALGIINEYGIA